MTITSRDQVTEYIITQKVLLNLSWAELARQLDLSKEWTTAACLGQMKFNKEQAQIVQQYFDLNDEQAAWLQIAPHKNSPGGIPSDPLLYRLHEVRNIF